MSRFARVVVSVASLACVAATAAPATAASRAEEPVIAVEAGGLSIVYNDMTISSAEADEIQVAAEEAGREFVLVYDPVSAQQGIAHAFDSRAEADAFEEASGIDDPKAVTAALRAGPEPTAAGSQVTQMSVPSACSSSLQHQSHMFDSTNCGGAYLAFFRVESTASFDQYGWNNRGDSLLVGYSNCVILVRLYPGPNYSYTEARFYGNTSSPTYYGFNTAQKNNFESAKSTCS